MSLSKKFLKFFLIFLFIFFFTLNKANAQENQQASEIRKKIEEYEKKLTEIRQQKNTLSSQIQYMDTQIYLTNLKIKETEEKIEKTAKEISILESKIEGLDDSLNYLSRLMINKIIQSYKQKNISIFDLFFDNQNAGNFINKLKYIKTVRDNNQKLLIQVQKTKLNFEEQKNLREEKKKELDNLKIILARQQEDLNNQKFAKQKLLNETQNSEIVYQNLLEKARKELTGFTTFVKAAGGGLINFGNGSNGWYYTQRDPRWGNVLLPGSSYSLLYAGCAVTSVAMVCKSYKQDVTPLLIASDPSKFIGGDLWNWAFSCPGKTTEWIGNSQEKIKEIVKNGNPVILRLIAPSVSGLHFIVAFDWNNEKNDFIIHDPYYGPDKYFSENYSWYQVTTAILIH